MEGLGGPTFALLFENLPGGPAAHLAEIDRSDDPEKFIATVLSVVEEFHPATYARIDLDQFRLHDEMALLQGGLRPVVRRAYAERGESPLIAIGDLRVTMDPVTGAGANLGSYGAWTLAEHISTHHGPFDLDFAERYAEAVGPRTTATVGFNNLVLAPPDYLVGLLMEMATNQAMCDEFTEGFANPEHLWFDIVKDADTAATFASTHR
jgi:2-polyprenyl-6-methoxyphenol hydroxylase-like FAD-dependent oxidoreductase